MSTISYRQSLPACTVPTDFAHGVMDALVLRDNPQVRPIYGDMRCITFAATTVAICYCIKATDAARLWRDGWYSDLRQITSAARSPPTVSPNIIPKSLSSIEMDCSSPLHGAPLHHVLKTTGLE